jgi:hypothetical protein
MYLYVHTDLGFCYQMTLITFLSVTSKGLPVDQFPAILSVHPPFCSGPQAVLSASVDLHVPYIFFGHRKNIETSVVVCLVQTTYLVK